MIIDGQEALTASVLEVMGRTADPRLRKIMVSLVKHLHGFVREVRLTEAELREATGILNEIAPRPVGIPTLGSPLIHRWPTGTHARSPPLAPPPPPQPRLA